MHEEIPLTRSLFKDENAIRWEFLEQQQDACAVVSERMEVLYLNAAGRALSLPDWYAKRCFEILPNVDGQCAWHCPTITAVSNAREITYCEEALGVAGEPSVTLGTAVIPMEHSEEVRDMLSGMLDIYLSSISNRMNAVMKVLTIIATMFIPLTFVAGVYGMNFEYMPELKWKYGYIGVWILMLVMAVAMVMYFKKKKWW